ncbi:hypothetical protein F66182_8589 [Fusarium sp. NRRL 66182]|nr:hypothetical protein F66182_8589 [Fusarium sp. NRRL 66182]
MCEQVITLKHCSTCKQPRGKLVRNINCERVTIFKFGGCRSGVSVRSVEEATECHDCRLKRETEMDEERTRKFREAWGDETDTVDAGNDPMEPTESTDPEDPVV